jgi:hypothetical protein
LQAGYEEPFVHFPVNESPPFLHPVVREYLGLAPTPLNTDNPTPLEERQCA